jgi:hypothetical protein
MASITITDIDWIGANPIDPQITTIQYRLTSDPDTPSYYITVATNVTVNQNGHLPTPVTISGLNPLTSYTVFMFNNCGGSGRKEIFITLTATCPAGYTISPDQTYCYKQTSVPADYIGGGSAYVICHNSSTSYNTAPTHIMKADGYDTQGVPLPGSQYIPVNIATGTFWYNPSPPTNDRGPLNLSGIWPCDGSGNPCGGTCPPFDTPVGFSRQFIVPTTKIYYIGVGSDNFATVTIQDNTGVRTIFEQNPTNIGNYFGDTSDPLQSVFASWLVYPVLLNAGPNIIEMTATNSGGAGVLGAEIYDNTESQLIAATSSADLNYVFSTNPDLGFINLGEPFEAGNYSCAAHPGSTLVYDSGTNTYSCVTIETVPPNP